MWSGDEWEPPGGIENDMTILRLNRVRAFFHRRKRGWFAAHAVTFALGTIAAVSVADVAQADQLAIQEPERMRTEFLKRLPKRWAVTQVLGSGQGELFFILDPMSPGSRQLVRNIQQLHDATVYYYLAPNGEYESSELSRRIWCARDRAQALLDVMLADRELPPAPSACDASVLQEVAFTVNTAIMRPRPGVLTARGLGAGVPTAAHLETVKFPYQPPARVQKSRRVCNQYNEEGVPDCAGK